MFPMCSAIRSLAISVALVVQVQAAAAQSLRFDLICSARGHVAADPQNQYPSGEHSWRTHLHYIVDLRTRRFCEPAICVHYGVGRVVAANARQIILFDEPVANRLHNSILVSVRNRDGYYSYRTANEEGYTRVETGFCRRARFSGFPAFRGPAWPPHY